MKYPTVAEVVAAANATPRKKHTAAHIGFVLTELDLGATFCELALSTRNERTKERNIRNARKAYNTALRFLWPLTLGIDEEALIEEKALRLKVLLNALVPIPDERRNRKSGH